MKKTITLFATAVFILIGAANIINAQSKLIHYWHFNNTLPTTGAGGTHLGTNAINADFTRYNSKAYVRFVKLPATVKDTGYLDNVIGDSTNQRVGYGSCCPAYGSTTNNSALRLRNPNDSMQFLCYIPTKNFKNIVVKYASQSSGSGPRRQNFDYSLDSGATFITTGLPKLFDSSAVTWVKLTVNLSAINTVTNTSKLMLRIRLGAPNTGSSGNARIDNITVEGDSIGGTTPTGIYSYEKGLDFTLFPNPANETMQIMKAQTELNNIAIKSITGQVLISKEIKENELIDIRQLNAGIYFLEISDSKTSEVKRLKFIKE